MAFNLPLILKRKLFNFKFKRKIRTWAGILTLDLQITSLAFYHLSYPGSIEVLKQCYLNPGSGSNFSLEFKGSNPGTGSNFSLEFKL